MESELLVILEQLERDKGIDKEVLIQAVEAAVASAAKKVWTVDKNEEVRAVLDRKTGKIAAFAGDQEIKSKDFGRIAAQTAKQVVIQKIREAEKDVVFNEYQTRIGQIVGGSIYRFDKGNIIVDLGKSEGFIPKSEQSMKEEFKQGDRIRAYVLDVKKDLKGPQIILSRANPNFVKRLFELEVPEIYEAIVEVKAIARDAGERTKIAVYSKDEKVDCLGACVGMRGSRVKSIVSELHGEKIDIVRYSSDIKEYIQAALSPAVINQIQLNKETKQADIIVADDQLSLAIGKHGQNVRLASRLLGWELNIRSVSQVLDGGKAPSIKGEKESAEIKEPKEPKGSKAAKPKEVKEAKGAKGPSLSDLEGVGEKLLEALKSQGMDTLEKIAGASVDDLREIKGVGKVKAEKIIKQAKELVK